MAEIANLGLGSDNPYLGKQNPYLQQIIDMTTKDMTDAYGRTAVPAQNKAALMSGSFGNAGLDEMQRADAGQLQRNIGDAASKLRFNDYGQQQSMYQWDRNTQQNQNQFDDQFGRSIFNDAYSQNQQNLQTGIGLLGTMAGYTANDYQTATGEKNTPLSYYTQFSNIANGLGGNGSTSTSTQGTTSNPLVSAIGGAQLGSKFSDWWGKQSNGGSAPISQANQAGFDSFGSSNGWWGTE